MDNMLGGAVVSELLESSHNTQSWQLWHLRTTSNGNKLEIAESGNNFYAN